MTRALDHSDHWEWRAVGVGAEGMRVRVRGVVSHCFNLPWLCSSEHYANRI